MLRFFRKMRKALVPENRFGRYFFYAMGEIVLVVIGILIALQINIWNELRKQRQKDVIFLKNMKTEIIQDISSQKNKQKELIEINRNLKQTLFLLKNAVHISEEEYEIINNSFIKFQILTPVFKNAGSNDINLSEGTLERIDASLNQKYNSYLKSTQNTNDVVAKLGEQLVSINIHYIMPKIDFSLEDSNIQKINFNFQEIKIDRNIKNAFVKSFFNREAYVNGISINIDLAEELLTLIDEYLSKIEN